ncbi:cysteine hydrolase family protein [Chloroflexota bacterium]
MQVINGKEVFTTIKELADPGYTALLLIDIQNDYITRGGIRGGLGDQFVLGQFVPNVKRVLEAARHSDILIVYLQFTMHPNFMAESPASLRGRLLRMGYKNGDSIDKLVPYCIDGTWGWQIIDELAPLPSETVIKKHRNSSFIGTSLDMILSSNGIKSVVIVGLVTHACVLATAIDAQSFGYCSIILRDCVISHKPMLHDAALLVMSESKDVVDSREILKVWDKGTLR